MKKRKTLLVAGVMTGLFVLLGAPSCSQQQVRDLEGVPVEQPDKVALIANVDQYPNVVALCIKGVGFVSTTRDGQAALHESPGLTQKWCAQ